MDYNTISHPKYYIDQSATIEPIGVLRFAPFDLGNALKYMIRAGYKEDELKDLHKALRYLQYTDETMHLGGNAFKLYSYFFSTYGLFLKAFKGLPDLDYQRQDAEQIIELYTDEVKRRIYLLEQKK